MHIYNEYTNLFGENRMDEMRVFDSSVDNGS